MQIENVEQIISCIFNRSTTKIYAVKCKKDQILDK